eukprot:CAMPEP_0119004590 /NCGR_PEP_ID=MMETSP1176-20130426/1235_1 /TAXON_ID=265551 /ORGANISM="Synedropsis recta cf, Strain CCMP1620" /LENGTH=199 /DNA_ID=CAMNT_0006956315 /DNA_START=182 /DNA_END=781 /DNA_ORIENTATION=-
MSLWNGSNNGDMLSSKMASLGNFLKETFDVEEEMRHSYRNCILEQHDDMVVSSTAQATSQSCRNRKLEHNDDMVMVSKVSSTDEGDMVVIFNEDEPTGGGQETAGCMMKGSKVVPVVGTGAAPPTPVKYDVLQPACDVCFALDGFSTNGDDDEKIKNKAHAFSAMNSCNPSMNINPPAFSVQSKKHGFVQRKTWGLPMV